MVFACPECRGRVAMLANPMETQMVKGLCVDVGERATPQRPLEGVRAHLGAPTKDAAAPTRPDDAPGDGAAEDPVPTWSAEAEARLRRIPGFVRGMVRQLYNGWARDHGLTEVTVEVMDRARADVGLEDM